MSADLPHCITAPFLGAVAPVSRFLPWTLGNIYLSSFKRKWASGKAIWLTQQPPVAKSRKLGHYYREKHYVCTVEAKRF